MDKEIVIIGNGAIAKTMAQFPGVVGYVNVNELEIILDPLNDRSIGNVNPGKHEGVIGIGKGHYKKMRMEQWKSKGFKLGKLIHPFSYVDPRSSIGEGSSVWPFSFVDGDSHIGEGTIIGSQSSIHYASVGDYCHVTFGVKLLPKSKIENYSFIGCNSTILEDIIIGGKSVIESNSRVSQDVKPSHYFISHGRNRQKPLADGMEYPLTNKEKAENKNKWDQEILS